MYLSNGNYFESSVEVCSQQLCFFNNVDSLSFIHCCVVERWKNLY